MKKLLLFPLCLIALSAGATKLLIPMDDAQTDHLRAYGIAYNALGHGSSAQWLLNYRGGSFLLEYSKDDEVTCQDKNVSFQVLPEAAVSQLMKEIENPVNNMSAVPMARAPKIAVHKAYGVDMWDDPVTLVLDYAGIPYDTLSDIDILQGKLQNYDWLHIHHEDFTGQYGRFYSSFSNAAWYKSEVAANETGAQQAGYAKVSWMKLAVAKQIRNFVSNGGSFFAMCSATDSYDIALATEGTDVCGSMFDGDDYDHNANSKLNYDACFAFTNFTLKMDPREYEFSNIDTYMTRSSKGVNETNDYFTLEDYSVVTQKDLCMLTQNHTKRIKGFWGQTTAFDLSKIKPGVAVMGSAREFGEARYIHGNVDKGSWTYFGGHDPEDYMHRIGATPTDISKHVHSPGYRLILDNILLPSTKVAETNTAVFRSYPNPATTQLTLEYEVSAAAVVTVYDESGQEVIRQSLSPDSKQVMLDLSGLADGNYIWRIMGDGKILSSSQFAIVK